MVNLPRWQIYLVLGFVLFGIVFAAPNLLDRKYAETLPGWAPSKQINLGLDLQGGAHLLAQVSVGGVLKDYLENLGRDVRRSLATSPRVIHDRPSVRGEIVSVRIRDAAQMEDALKRVRELIRENYTSAPSATAGGFQQGGPDFTIEQAGADRITLTLTDQAKIARTSSIIEQTIEVVRKRIDELGTREPTIQRQGDDRILIQLPGEKDPERAKAVVGTTAKMTFHMVHETAVPPNVPIGYRLVPTEEGDARYVIEQRTRVSGERLVDAQPSFEQNRPVVAFRFDSLGAKQFCDITRKSVGKLFAIVLDGKIISAPQIRSPICGGSGIITGGFTPVTANNLAVLLRAGALPADITWLEERTVGPGLGRDSIEAGKIASLIGVVLVIVFMIAAYGLFGMMADIALTLNLVMIVAALSMLQATLTLPGIAGIVLTIGMAVDANVLIFERIREEVRAGRTPINAVDAGYRRALTTIVDSNLTTLIAALLLFEFGTGPIKGFAVTLAIGIATSMFTAIMVTRFMVVTWLRRRRPASLPI